MFWVFDDDMVKPLTLFAKYKEKAEEKTEEKTEEKADSDEKNADNGGKR